MSILDFDALSLIFDHYMSTDRSLLGTLPPSRPENSAPFDFGRHTSTDDEPLKTHEPTQQYARTVYARTVGHTDFSLKSSDSHPMDPFDPKYQCTENERFLLQDIERHKVFVDIEDFMHSVLLIPIDWRIEYGSLIKYVRNDRGFITSLRKYLRFCDRGNIADVDLRPGFLIPAAQLLVSRSKNDRFIPRTYPLDDSKWAQLLRAGEREHLNCTLVDGRSGKRIKDRNGDDPAEAHQKPGRKRYYSHQHKIPIQQRKRKADEEINRDAKRHKVQSAPVEQTLVSVWSVRVPLIVLPETEANGYSDPSRSKENAKATMLQVVRYLVEKFSASALRSHVTAGLIDRDRLQLFHANHSVLFISRAICLKESDDLDMFIAILIGLHKMTLRQLGVMDIIDQHREFLSDSGFYGERVGEGVTQNHKKMHDGNTMTLRQKVPGKKPIVINLDGILNREPSIIGRSTSTLYGTSDEWPGVNLVIKVSFPSNGRVSEETFLNTATEKAKEFEKDGERYWVLDHLPKLLHAETAVLDEIEENVKELCTTREYVGGEKSSYDERRRRILVYEMLQPLQTLTTAMDFAQVFADVIITHKWLYDHPRILHRDISMDNIMYRIGADGTIYGVLNDFDLSSFRDAIGVSNSVQRTGTPPFMAMDVLNDAQYHYYRHDLESIFYVMLVIASRHELKKPARVVTNAPFLPRHLVLRTSGKLPLAEWFNFKSTYKALANDKAAFLKRKEIDLTPSFECLGPWLREMMRALHKGVAEQDIHSTKVEEYEASKNAADEEVLFADETSHVRPTVPPPPPFNDRTLDDHVTFKIFVRPAAPVIRGLGGKFRNRYNGPEFAGGD